MSRYPEPMLTALTVPDALRGFVDGIWTHTGNGRPHRVLPDGCLDFIFNLERGTATLVGPMTRAILVPVPAGMTSFGVRFRPGCAARFIDAHASELCDDQTALVDVTRVASLAERIADAPNHAARTEAVTRALLESRARTRGRDRLVERGVALIARTRGAASVSALAAELGLSERQLERRFLERVGLGPKRLARIVRFEHALELARQSPASQAEIAARAGYSDEPHLVREVRALSGLSFQALRRERAAEPAQDVGFVQGERRRSR